MCAFEGDDTPNARYPHCEDDLQGADGVPCDMNVRREFLANTQLNVACLFR